MPFEAEKYEKLGGWWLKGEAVGDRLLGQCVAALERVRYIWLLISHLPVGPTTSGGRAKLQGDQITLLKFLMVTPSSFAMLAIDASSKSASRSPNNWS